MRSWLWGGQLEHRAYIVEAASALCGCAVEVPRPVHDQSGQRGGTIEAVDTPLRAKGVQHLLRPRGPGCVGRQFEHRAVNAG
jgi:hypothetical protein